MANRKDITKLKQIYSNLPEEFKSKENETLFATAIYSLQLDIPKKPLEWNKENEYFVCPSCKTATTYLNDNYEYHQYCCLCGQAIKWDK